MALVTTVGGATSNSYVSMGEADNYFLYHWCLSKQDLWAGLSFQQKEQVLKAACQVLDTLRVLDNYLSYGSLPPALQTDYDTTVTRLAASQRLSFPRNVDVDGSNVGFIP